MWFDLVQSPTQVENLVNYVLPSAIKICEQMAHFKEQQM
jgi:hypothetical protein